MKYLLILISSLSTHSADNCNNLLTGNGYIVTCGGSGGSYGGVYYSTPAMTLYDSKDKCMEMLKNVKDPTQGYCVAVNGFSKELKAY